MFQRVQQHHCILWKQVSSATNHAVDDRLAVCEWPSTVYDWLRRRKYIDDDVDDDDNDDDDNDDDDDG